MHEDELVPVFNATSEVEALLYRTMLEEAGIDVIERPFEADWFESIKLDGLHSQLLVRAEDAEEAGQLAADFTREAETGVLSAPDAPNQDDKEVYGTPES